jgi:hypothetical protein
VTDAGPDSGRRPGGTLSLFLGRIGGVAGPLVVGQILLGVTYIVGARSISPGTLGLVATCAAIGQVAAVVVDLGLVNYLVREAAAGRLDDARARALVAAKRPWALALLLAVGLATSLAIAPTVPSAILLAFVGVGVWEAQNANGLLRARERFARASAGQLAGAPPASSSPPSSPRSGSGSSPSRPPCPRRSCSRRCSTACSSARRGSPDDGWPSSPATTGSRWASG